MRGIVSVDSKNWTNNLQYLGNGARPKSVTLNKLNDLQRRMVVLHVITPSALAFTENTSN